MGMKQSIIDWLESVPGPTEAQARRWRRVRWGLVGLAVLAEVVMWYVLYRMNVSDPPLWLKAPTNWIFENIPAAQGNTNLSFSLREKMPYIFTIEFVFSHLVALSILIFDHDRVPFGALKSVLNMGRIKSLLYLVLGEAVFFFLIYLLLYGFSSEVSFDSERTYLANIDESPLALMVAWVPIYFVVGAILGQHMVFVRDVVLRASIWRCS